MFRVTIEKLMHFQYARFACFYAETKKKKLTISFLEGS
jgi:hypothetical protein